MSTQKENLSDPQFEAELSFYASDVAPDVSMYYNKAVSQGTRASYAISNGNLAIENIKKFMDNLRSEIRTYHESVKSNNQRKRTISSNIRELKDKREETFVGTQKRHEYNQRIQSLKKEKKSLKDGQKQRESKYQKALRKLSSYKKRLAEKKKEVEENKQLLEKAKHHKTKCIQSARKQFKFLGQVKSILEFSKQINYNNLGTNSVEKLGRIQAFQQACHNLPKVSLLTPIDQEATNLIQAYNEVRSMLTVQEKTQVHNIFQKEDLKRKLFVKQRVALNKFRSIPDGLGR